MRPAGLLAIAAGVVLAVAGLRGSQHAVFPGLFPGGPAVSSGTEDPAVHAPTTDPAVHAPATVIQSFGLPASGVTA